ncbi:MAG: S8 family serine peptidase [Vulcanimicrobiota bacterium]
MVIQSFVQRMPVAAPVAAARQPEVSPTDGLSRSAPFDLDAAVDGARKEAASLAEKLIPGEFVPGQVIVKLEGGLSAESLGQLAEDYQSKVMHCFDAPGAMAERLGGKLAVLELGPRLSTAEGLAVLGRDPRVAYAESNDIVHSFSHDPAGDQAGEALPPVRPAPAPNEGLEPDDLLESQWNMKNDGQDGGRSGADIDATRAWSLSTGRREDGPIVAVLDTGIDWHHPDLVNNLWTNPREVADNQWDDDGNGYDDDLHGANFVSNSGDPNDDNGYGTHAAGIIAAEGNNRQGVTGVNWEGRIMGLKFLGSGRGGTTVDAMKALLYAEQNGARITNNSWGGYKYNQALADVMRSSSALHVCAAGDDGYDNDRKSVYPASFNLDNVLAVAASDRNDRLPGFTNRGAESVDLCAPGTDIYSTLPGGQFGSKEGTAMAAPHVAGVAALIAARYPGVDNQAIKNRILTGVDPIPRYGDQLASGGRLNAFGALEDDQIAPDSPLSFRVEQTDGEKVTLAWKATGDDGTEGQSTSYDLRYAPGPIGEGQGQIPFSQATPVGIGRPGPSGHSESVAISFPPSGADRELHFALQSLDNVGNRSVAATTSTSVPGRPVAFEDSMDADTGQWGAQGEWARVDSPGRGQVYTDSPGGDYGPGRDQSLTSKPVDLTHWKGAELHFDSKVDTEDGYDKCKVEVYGKKWWRTAWRAVATLDGEKDWAHQKIDLSDYDGQEIKLRFRFLSDDSRHRDGVYIDNVVITGNPGA